MRNSLHWTTTKKSFNLIILSVAILILSSSLLYAEKTDVVVLRNGNEITGEIKKLELLQEFQHRPNGKMIARLSLLVLSRIQDLEPSDIDVVEIPF